MAEETKTTIARPGQFKQVTSVSNPIIKDIRGLALRKNRNKSNRFLGEGLKLITDALQKKWPIEQIIYGKAVIDQDAVAQAAAKVRAAGGSVLEVSNQVLEKISRKDNPQMVLGVFEQQFTPLSEVRPNGDDLWVALDRVRDPGNLGTTMRTADCVGAKGIILIGDCTDAFSIEAVRASMGSVFHVPLVKTSESDFIKWKERFPGRVIGTHLAGAVDYRTVDYGNPSVILMGNEQQGLTDALTQACDQLALIPMAGQADSINLAVSTGIVLFEARKAALTL
ncbi:MAG: RNA methyltransferase [Hyphomicrobiales bacterium]|nr:MAG: RNA methyltransferase [Hyphomicrobiales bacterium]